MLDMDGDCIRIDSLYRGALAERIFQEMENFDMKTYLDVRKKEEEKRIEELRNKYDLISYANSEEGEEGEDENEEGDEEREGEGGEES